MSGGKMTCQLIMINWKVFPVLKFFQSLYISIIELNTYWALPEVSKNRNSMHFDVVSFPPICIAPNDYHIDLAFNWQTVSYTSLQKRRYIMQCAWCASGITSYWKRLENQVTTLCRNCKCKSYKSCYCCRISIPCLWFRAGEVYLPDIIHTSPVLCI